MNSFDALDSKKSLWFVLLGASIVVLFVVIVLWFIVFAWTPRLQVISYSFSVRDIRLKYVFARQRLQFGHAHHVRPDPHDGGFGNRRNACHRRTIVLPVLLLRSAIVRRKVRPGPTGPKLVFLIYKLRNCLIYCSCSIHPHGPASSQGDGRVSRRDEASVVWNSEAFRSSFAATYTFAILLRRPNRNCISAQLRFDTYGA